VRTIGAVTVGRSDYGIFLPVLRRIQKDPDLSLHLLVTGMHLSPEFGSTVNKIEEDGFEIGERVEMLLSSDTPQGIAKSMGLGTIGFAQAYDRLRPDILLVLGDRFETHAAVAASLPFGIPVAHIHGGESSEGAIDDAIRHSITKMSHLHFVSTEFYGRRVIQMGEEPWRVVVSGAPSLDNLEAYPLLSTEELDREYGLDLAHPTVLVTYHPVTLEYEDTQWQAMELLAALEQAGFRIVFTYPNADTHGRVIINMINEFASRVPRARVVDNLGTRAYFSVMSHAVAMVGNSSSGIIEAASFNLPVVNVGNRQRGRVHGENVIDVGYGREDILQGIAKAASADFRAGLTNLSNRYGDGHAAERIVDKLRDTVLDERLFLKCFYSGGGDAAEQIQVPTVSRK
jgi:UDP-hydrolysing UDP-N-acetyl-D-glucosamine 2-epimerase